MTKDKAREFFRRFHARDPEPKGELFYTNPYTLLVAVALSAQATDKGVNKATPALFKIADTPAKMLKLGEDKIRDYIKTIGLFNSKAKNVYALSKILVDEYDGIVPQDRDELVKLPGVGRKTANVVLNIAFGQPTMAARTGGMFAPFPSYDDGWYAIPAVAKNGQTFDAFTRQAVVWEKPAEPRLLFRNERWRKYMTNLWMQKFRPQWRGYAEWACQSSKKYDGPRNRIESLQVYYMLERTPPPGQTPKIEKVEVFGKYWCNPDDAPEEIRKQYGVASRNP